VAQNHLQIISDLGGPAAIADTLNVNPVRVRMWKQRKKLPRSVWPELIEAYPALSMETLKAAEAA
jgi:hypothetical protein